MKQIQELFQLKMELLRLEGQIAESSATLRQAKFDLREAKVAEAEYRGSFKSFRDKLAGRREESETALRHAAQQAEAALAAAQRHSEILNTRLAEVKEQLAILPDWQSLQDESPEWYRLEALYCITVLHPLLTVCLELLVDRRNQFNGSYAGQIKTHQDLAEVYSAPEAAGEACKSQLLRLKAALDALAIPFEPGPFFDAPTAFLSEATKFTRMDRVNTAIVQTEALQQQLLQLQKELSK